MSETPPCARPALCLIGGDPSGSGMAGRSPRRVGQGLGGPHSPNGFARQATSLTKSFCLLVRVFAKPRGPARPVVRLRPQSSRIRRAARSASGCNVGLRSPQSRGRSGSADEHRSDVTAFRGSKRQHMGDIALAVTGPQGNGACPRPRALPFAAPVSAVIDTIGAGVFMARLDGTWVAVVWVTPQSEYARSSPWAARRQASEAIFASGR